MKFVLTAMVVLAFVPGALAVREAYDLQLELSIGGAQTRARVKVNDGEAAMIEEVSSRGAKTFIEVVATRIENPQMAGEKKAVSMRFNVGTVDHGKKTTVSSLRIVALEGEPARITESDERGNEKLALTAIFVSARL